MGKLTFTKDGIFKKVTDQSSGKSKVFVPIEEARKQQNSTPDIKELANQLAQEVLAKLLANLPTQSVIIQQSSQQHNNVVDIDNSIAVTASDDISQLETSSELGDTSIKEDNTVEQARNKLRELKNRKS